MKNLILTGFIAIGMLISATSCKKKDAHPFTKVIVSLDTIAAQYYEKYLKLHPLEATAQGDHRYNDQLPIDIDQDFIKKEIALYQNTTELLKKVDYERLSDDQKVIYDVLDYSLKDKIEAHIYHPEYIPFTQFYGLPIDFPVMGSGLGTQPFKTEIDYDDWLKRMEKFPSWMKKAEENFRAGTVAGIVLPKKLVMKMILQMRSKEIITEHLPKNIFYGPILNFPKYFSKVLRKKYTLLYHQSIYKNIIPAYQQMGDFLENEYLPMARNTDGYNALPGGKEAYDYYVKSWTTTRKSPSDLNAIGLQQVEILKAEMNKIQQQLGFLGTREDFLHHLAQDSDAMPYKSSEEIIAAFNEILVKITPSLKTMFNVTPKTPFEIRQTEKFREATASAEYIPGTSNGKRPGIFYVPLPNPKKFNLTSGMESLFLHEAIPGHHYQISLQQENMALPKFMRFGWFGAYGEGWAHYCETLGPELGLYLNPYQKIGYLNDQMLRAVRLVVDTGIHTGKMTREQAIQYFISHIAYDEKSATAEVERYMALPGQALGYKIGSLKIRELRDKYSKSLGKKFNLAQFHDEILSQGCLPLDVLEMKMELWAQKR